MRLVLLALAFVAPVMANQQARGWCELGGQRVTTSGIQSTSRVQASFPNCTVNVYNAGTLTHSTIYSDNAGTPTPLANPFTASAQGYWFFYAADGCYDITLSGGSPSFPAPFTIYYYCLNSGGGGGGFTPPVGLQRQYLQITPNVLPQPSYRFSYQPFIDMGDFNFPSQSLPNISIGSNTITLAPVPLGVNWFDQNHYLYVSGGSGNAEACLIDSAGPGTATGGSASGTLTIDCANVHTGANITSATAGLAEAWNTGLNVHAAPGTYDFYAGVTPPTSGSLMCEGDSTVVGGIGGTSGGQVVMRYHPTTGNMFNVIHNLFFIHGCSLRQIGTAVSSVAISTYGTLSTAPVHEMDVGTIEHVSAYGFYYGFKTDGGTGLLEMIADWAVNSVSDGFNWGVAQAHIIDCVSEFSQTGNGITFHLSSSGAEEPVPWLTGWQSFSNYGWGAYANEASFHFSGMVNYFGNDRLGEIYYNYHFSSLCDNCTFAESGKPGVPNQFPVNTTARGVFVDSNGGGLVLNNALFGGIEGSCFYSIGTYNRMVNSEFLGGQDGCGVGGIANNIYALDTGESPGPNGGQLNQIMQSRFASPVRLAGDGTMFVHNVVALNESSVPLVHVSRGLQVDVGGGYYFNNAGIAFQCDSGVTIADSSFVIGAGSQVINCTGQASTQAVPKTLAHYTVAGAPSANLSAFTQALFTDANPGTTPCVGGGSGATAWSDGSTWHCEGTGATGVVSFNGRTGIVVSQAGDYNTLQVSGALNAVASSATPTFDLSLGTIQTMILTGNTTATITNIQPNLLYQFRLCQDGTGSHTFTWPVSVFGAMTVGYIGSRCNTQSFVASSDGLSLYAQGAGVINQ